MDIKRIAWLCDKKACERCEENGPCRHTLNYEHAIHKGDHNEYGNYIMKANLIFEAIMFNDMEINFYELDIEDIKKAIIRKEKWK